MNFNKNLVLSLISSLIFSGMNLSAQNLTVCSVEFPDTVKVWEMATLKGYVLNKDNITYTEDIIINIDIKDTAPESILNDGEVNRSITIDQSNLAPNDSIYFEKDLLVNPQEFGVASTDLVVVWPQASANDSIINKEADIALTYVQDEAETDTTILDKSAEYDYLPESIIEYITIHYPDASIDHIRMDQSDFKIKLDNDVQLIFSVDGKLQKKDEDKDKNTYEDDDDDDGLDDDDDRHDNEDGKEKDKDKGGSNDDDDEGYLEDDDEKGNWGDDDDEENSSDDDDNSFDNDNDYGDDDDDYGKLSNGQVNAAPFKITSKNNLITVTAVNNFKITSLELYSLNGKYYRYLSDNSFSAMLHLNLKHMDSQLMVLRIFLQDADGNSIEFNRKINVGF